MPGSHKTDWKIGEDEALIRANPESICVVAESTPKQLLEKDQWNRKVGAVIGYVSCLVVVLTGGTVMAQDYYSFSSDFYGQRAAAKMDFAPSPERLHREMKYLEMRMRFQTFTLWDAKRWKQYKYEQETKYYRNLYYRLKDYTLPPEEYRRKYHPDDE